MTMRMRIGQDSDGYSCISHSRAVRGLVLCSAVNSLSYPLVATQADSCSAGQCLWAHQRIRVPREREEEMYGQSRLAPYEVLWGKVFDRPYLRKDSTDKDWPSQKKDLAASYLSCGTILRTSLHSLSFNGAKKRIYDIGPIMTENNAGPATKG